jgi:glycosyltransferase involved in cell wall biosynthesis
MSNILDVQAKRANKTMSIAIVTSIHPDFDVRIWKHATSLARAGCCVHLICPWKVKNGATIDAVKMYPFARLHNRILRLLLSSWQILRALRPIFSNVDVIHFHDINILPIMALVSLFKPVVYDVHENYADEMLVKYWIPLVLRLPLYWAVRVAHVIFPLIIKNIVLVVPQQENEFRSKRLRKIQIRNYASLRLLNDYKDDYLQRPNTILFTGGHYDENGSMLLLEIAEIMLKRAVSAQIIATDRFVSNSYRERFESEIKLRKLSNIQIISCVPPEKIMNILNKGTIASILGLRVAKSIKGIPTRLFEYMAAGLPIVSGDFAFQGEVVGAEHAGILAQPENPDSFVDAIEQLIKDKPFARSLGQNGQRAFKENYSWESQIPTLLNFYKEILNH